MTEREEARATVADEVETLEPELIVEEGAVENETGATDWERIAREREADLLRARADFDNFRKRVMREQAEVNARAARGFIERLLPVLDNFDRAAAHGEASPGFQLLHRELMDVLSGEGVTRLEPKGEPFDPHQHEAVESHEDEQVEEPTVSAVHRAGYLFRDKLLRPALVAVARPAEPSASEAAEQDGG
ncbi:MAG TPA: nucleotide exchange factor GrpE [Actinomycetota bacterium]|jgi:molecular chaperone GrpE|nr:nucleotide exchange factor GrpE [Actinomycetota bacterium]